MRLIRTVLVALTLSFIVAGCRGGLGGQAETVATSSPSATSTVPAEKIPSATAATTVTTGATPPAPAPRTITIAPGAPGDFRLPSGNIGCSGFASSDFNVVVCEARQHDWSLPPKPASCEFEWVAYLEVRATGPGSMGICTSNFLVGDGSRGEIPPPFVGPVVPYGSSIRIGAILCRSEARGLTCTNPEGHGFFLSRERAEAF